MSREALNIPGAFPRLNGMIIPEAPGLKKTRSPRRERRTNESMTL